MKDGNFIQFLGTGAGDCLELYPPTPADAKKIADKYPSGRSFRHGSSLFVSPDIVVDFISSGQMQACGIPEATVKHLLITHAHDDHFQPLAILDAVSGLPHPWTVYGNTAVGHAMDFATAHRWHPEAGRFEWIEHAPKIPVQVVNPGQTFTAGAARITPLAAKHMIDTEKMIQQEQCLNYVIERDGKALFYGLDSSYVLPESMEILSAFQLDIAIFDATFGHLEIAAGKSGHQNFEMLDETIAQFREAGLFKQDAVLVADHISYYEVEPYEEIVEELADKGIVLAYDGMTLPF
ncbi:MAG: MBL fold metallo-hydrolase [Candidatus Latescibacterota bacterium]